MTVLENSVAYWMMRNNVEYIACGLQDYHDVEFGVHKLLALGNDLMRVGVYIDTESSLALSGDIMELLQLKPLAQALLALRYEEVKGYA
jgi:hypothetical protein